MSNAIFAYFILCAALSLVPRFRANINVILVVSLISLANVNQKVIVAGIILLAINYLLVQLAKRAPVLYHPLVPLLYSAFFISLHHALNWRITGFSYLMLSAAWDLHMQLKYPGPAPLKQLVFNLLSFAKSVVGPITKHTDHSTDHPEKLREQAFPLAAIGLAKAYLLAPLFIQVLPMPPRTSLSGIVDYLSFGLWNYVHLYLEFSGVTQVVAASFLILSVNCPINFNRPYLACTVTDFWRLWHMTLGSWIRQHIYIALGGNRLSSLRTYLNLLIAMTICGVWHGIAFNFAIWGLLQGALLIVERVFNFEALLNSGSALTRLALWLWTQTAVTISWIVFFWI